MMKMKNKTFLNKIKMSKSSRKEKFYWKIDIFSKDKILRLLVYLFISQILAVLSREAETTKLPVECQLADHTACKCSENV